MDLNRRVFLKCASFAAFVPSVAMASDATRTVDVAPWRDTDVLVVGGGLAGVCVAISAARSGGLDVI